MSMSRKDLLMGLMHSAEQGKKLREGTNLANKKLNEGDTRTPNLGSVSSPGSGFSLQSRSDVGELSQDVNSDVRGNLRAKDNSKDDPKNPNWLKQHNARFEQGRREKSEAEMRRRSAPDAAINREPVMPSELKKESNESRRGRIILETISALVEASKPDFLDFDKDGNKKEPMKKAIKDRKRMSENVDTKGMGIGEIPPMTVSPKTAATKIKGKREIDTTGVAQGERSSTGLGMNTTRPSSGGVSSRTAGVAQGERSSTGLGMNTTFSGY